MTVFGIGLAILAGIVSFASPCCLPLVPAYVGYMVDAAPGDSPADRRAGTLRQALAFVAGFSVVFVALWASVGLVGYLLRDEVWLLRDIGGGLLVFLGLHVAGVIDVTALYHQVRLPVALATGGAGFGAPMATPSYRRSALLGIVFAAGWTPCVGPILGGIIGLASVSGTVLEGTLLLIAYAAGLAIPFVLVAIGATSATDHFGWFRDHRRAVDLASGALLVGIGFLMITNSLARLSQVVPAFGL
jgi:cytochrome c-type biogenesis protein